MKSIKNNFFLLRNKSILSTDPFMGGEEEKDIHIV